MKNFPHQYNELGRIRGTLTVIEALLREHKNVLDDDVLGYALAREGVYTFRGAVPDLDRRIAEEREKPAANQGARTAAREGRRTLQLLGFTDAQGNLTEAGSLLLTYQRGSQEELALWQQAIVAIQVSDADGNLSHPVRILLRLLADRGPLARIELALALEARDDSQEEYDRLLRLIPVRDSVERGILDVSKHQLHNAIKILPAFALQVGLAVDLGDERLAISENGMRLYRADFQFGAMNLPAQDNVQRVRSARRRAGNNAREITGTGAAAPPFRPDAFAALSPSEQIEAARLRAERTQRHQEIVRQVAAEFSGAFTVLEDPFSFDSLLVPRAPDKDTIFLLEMKTLDLDEVSQTMQAVAQVLWYRWLIAPQYPDKVITLGVVYDRQPTEETIQYLQSLSIGAFSCIDGVTTPLNETARALRH